jgi:putative membrane protein
MKQTGPDGEERDMTREWWAPLGMMLWIWPSLAAAQERPHEWGWGMHPMWGMWGVWGIGMMLMMLVFWVVVIVGIVLGIRWLLSQGNFTRADSALQVLRERYARGEINKDEFDAKKRDLS